MRGVIGADQQSDGMSGQQNVEETPQFPHPYLSSLFILPQAAEGRGK